MSEPEAPKCCAKSRLCTGPVTEPHTCPYDEEINDDRETLCHCCDACAQECSDDI